ncbi:MAG TPA: hypothetical protein ENI95_12270 [Chloroflexi bacterium]|nr:hypothetical protein [Chloroflexota bacterium]
MMEDAGRADRAAPGSFLSWRWIVTLVLLVMGLGVAAYRSAILHEEMRQLVIVIPPGTAERLAAGETENTPPHRIDLTLGVQDVLVIRNEDSVWHQVGPYRVAPGHTLVQRFSQPGTIQAACTMTPSQQVEIVIHERR